MLATFGLAHAAAQARFRATARRALERREGCRVLTDEELSARGLK
jgi:hypothetical protein